MYCEPFRCNLKATKKLVLLNGVPDLKTKRRNECLNTLLTITLRMRSNLGVGTDNKKQ